MSIQNEKLVNLADAKVLYDDLRGRIVERYVVELTAPEDPQTHMPDFNSITCNKTIAEMTEAYNAGKEIVGILNYSVQKIGLQVSVTEVSYGSVTMLQFSFMSQQIGDGGVFQAIGYSNGEDVWFAGTYMSLLGYIDYSSQGDRITYSASNSRIANVKDPTANKDAANKQYVDTAVSGSAPVQYLAPLETTAISTRAYAVGDIFVCKGITGGLCKATSAIAIGDTIVAGSTSGCNCVVIDNLVTNIPSDVQINGTSIVQNGVANVPIASNQALGVVSIDSSYGIMKLNNAGMIGIVEATVDQVKGGTAYYRPICPERQHMSVFYGLSKAAGVDMASSSNAVGTYTPEAKAAIQTMIGVDPGVVFVEEVTGTTPTITGVANTRYICGEVAELTITPPSSGTIDVRFTSGTTPTVLTIPSTVKFPAWVDLTTIEASTTYEIMITDGVYGGVMTWPV